MQYDFLQLVISSLLIHALGDPNQAPTRIWTQFPDWEADDLPIELSIPCDHCLVELWNAFY